MWGRVERHFTDSRHIVWRNQKGSLKLGVSRLREVDQRADGVWEHREQPKNKQERLGWKRAHSGS